MTNPQIPRDFVLDVHDLAAIIIDCHARTGPTFPNAQLVEVVRGNALPQTLPAHVLPGDWYTTSPEHRRVAYIVRTNSNAPEKVTIDTFAAPEGVKSPLGRDLTRRELEDIFWRCKDFNSGYVLAYVAQQIFDSLPVTATLRARTSAGHEIICAPNEVTVAEIDIRPKEACLMVDYEPRPDLGPSKVNMTQHLSGFDLSMLWIYLLIGQAVTSNLSEDPRVALDLVTPQIGGRGDGGELFALERGWDYHHKVLAKVADEFEGFKLSGKLRLSPPDVRRRGDALKTMVMARLIKIANGQDNFCRYCGKDGVESRCSKCKKAFFCPPCQALGWKYHKVWCK